METNNLYKSGLRFNYAVTVINNSKRHNEYRQIGFESITTKEIIDNNITLYDMTKAVNPIGLDLY